jgi:prepilin-type N-terminal cleavage/methylation domain-containing protein
VNKEMIRRLAFSLIELMVVIAIVALLAAIAVPSYKAYRTNTKLGSIANSVGSILSKANLYSETAGIYPTSQQLGFPLDSNNDFRYSGTGVVDGTFDPNMVNLSLGPGDFQNGKCKNSVGLLLFHVLGTEFGTTGYLEFTCQVWSNLGVDYHSCDLAQIAGFNFDLANEIANKYNWPNIISSGETTNAPPYVAADNCTF